MKAGGDPKDTKLMVFGDDFDTRDGTCIRDYIHVNDLCSVHIKAFERMLREPDAGAEQFNLGVNRGYTVLEVIQASSKVTGIDLTFNKIERRAGDPSELVADATLAMQKLNGNLSIPMYPFLSSMPGSGSRSIHPHREKTERCKIA